MCHAGCRLQEQLEAVEAKIQTDHRADMRNVGMASVNRKNAARNFENAFKNVGARPEGARTADDGVDPFSRRKTRPMNYWTTKRTAGAEDAGAHLCMSSFGFSCCLLLDH